MSEARFIAQRLHWMAEAFEAHARQARHRPADDDQLDERLEVGEWSEEAGRLTLRAAELGYLDAIPELRTVALWVETGGANQTVYGATPATAFALIAGDEGGVDFDLEVRSGQVHVVEPAEGRHQGILARHFPSLLAPPSLPTWVQWARWPHERQRERLRQLAAARHHQRMAHACRILADLCGSHAAASDEGFLAEPALTKTQEAVLQAMFEMGADHADRRRKGDEIAPKAGYENVKHALAGLGRLGLTASHGGAAGGSWLTPAGRHRALRMINAT